MSHECMCDKYIDLRSAAIGQYYIKFSNLDDAFPASWTQP